MWEFMKHPQSYRSSNLQYLFTLHLIKGRFQNIQEIIAENGKKSYVRMLNKCIFFFNIKYFFPI